MKTIAVVPKQIKQFFPIETVSEVSIEGNSVYLACLNLEQPEFGENIPMNSRKVLVQVESFSCNYRDKAIIVKNALMRDTFPLAGVAPFAFFGSDFVAKVLRIGSGVRTLQVGDRVIPDCSYPVARENHAAPGVVTNEASRGWLILDEAKLMKIPDSMPNNVAAGFSIGAQTAHSLVRRTVRSKNDRVLITSARSNTAQFVAWILHQRGVRCDLVSTSTWSDEELSYVHPSKIVQVNRGSGWADAISANTYDVVIDPFFDLHIDESIDILRTGGRYITCGYKNQHASFRDSDDATLELDLHRLMLNVMIKNITLIGNCIGYSEDLESAISIYDSNKVPPIPVDAVFDTSSAEQFIERTYNSRGRLGKAVMVYTS